MTRWIIRRSRSADCEQICKYSSCRPEDSISYIETGEAFFTETTVRVILKDNEAYKQLWSEWNRTEAGERDFTVGLVIDWDINDPVPLTVGEYNGKLCLKGKVKLDPVDSFTSHTVEICIDGKIVYGGELL